VHSSGENLARDKLSPMLEAMTDAGDPKSEYDYEDDACDERQTEDIRPQSLRTELREGSGCGHGVVCSVSLSGPFGCYYTGGIGG